MRRLRLRIICTLAVHQSYLRLFNMSWWPRTQANSSRKGVPLYLKDHKAEDMTRMFRLFSESPDVNSIYKIFKQHIVSEGMALVKDSVIEDTNAVVGKLIAFHDKYMKYVIDSFMSNPLFDKALGKTFKTMVETFETFLNQNVAGSSCAELLAIFCDNILKKDSSVELSDEEIEETLRKVVMLFGLVSDKDLFGEFHWRMLAQRLFLNRGANEGHEKSILTKLNQQWGHQFTSKMEKMLVDFTSARENRKKFSGVEPGIDLRVTLLAESLWPPYNSCNLQLPSEMARCLEVFNNSYKTVNKTKKLTWMHSLGTCTINCKFEQKDIELIVQTYQAAALLLFETDDKLSYSDIKTKLNLSDANLVRVLHSLPVVW